MNRTELGDLPLESGEILLDCEIAWVEHGSRNAAGDNTVLVLCAIGSTHRRLDFLIGAGRALDPSRHHIVAVNALGNGLSSSPSSSKRQPGRQFPAITIRDMVESQRRVLDALGLGSLRAVIGASMGGMQALQWAVSHPQRVKRVVAMTAMARCARWSQLANELSRRALFGDDECRVPRARADAMRLWTPLTQLTTPTTPEYVAARFASRESMVDWLHAEQGRLETDGPDPFDWLCQTRAYDAHDIGKTPGFGGDTAAALRAIRATTLLIAPPLDLYNPAAAAREDARSIPGARFIEIPSIRGHRSAAVGDERDTAFLNDTIREFLA